MSLIWGCAALFYVHSYDALIGPGMADLMPSIAAAPTPLRQAMEKLRMTMDAHIDHALKAVA